MVTPFVNTSIAGWVWYACIHAELLLVMMMLLLVMMML
jgi:hypothetical protein